MNIESLRSYCLSLRATDESLPFDDDVIVFKVAGKIFALISISDPSSVNLKCDPEYAVQLREQYPDDVLPGYHMNKKHWNTVEIMRNLPDSMIRQLIDHSYEQVVKGLPKKLRGDLGL